MAAERSALAIDIGGTQVRAAHVSAGGRVERRSTVPTPKQGGRALGDVVCQLIADLARDEASQAIDTVGIASPGPLDPRAGIVYAPPNLRGWTDFALGPYVTAKTGRPVSLGNDAALAALGESRLGAGKGFDPVLYVTVSTGIGGGLISGGQVFEGAHGMACELGGLIVSAEGGGRTIEDLASGPAIAQRMQEALAREADPARRAMAIADWTAIGVAKAARAGDAVALRVFEEAGKLLGLALATFVNVFDPARVVVGGGVSGAWDLWANNALERLPALVMAWHARRVEIVRAAYGDDAGLIGAALHALDSESR